LNTEPSHRRRTVASREPAVVRFESIAEFWSTTHGHVILITGGPKIIADIQTSMPRIYE
jgi:hypothetical protein